MSKPMTGKTIRPLRNSLYTVVPMLLILSWNTSCNNEVPAEQVAEPKDSTVATVTNGVLEIQVPDGGMMRGEVVDGVRQGPWTSYFEDGTTRSRGSYVDGEMDGPTEVYHPNGMPLYSGQYRMGVPVGEWRFYDLGGVLIRTAVHDSSGQVVGE